MQLFHRIKLIWTWIKFILVRHMFTLKINDNLKTKHFIYIIETKLAVENYSLIFKLLN